MTAKGLWLLVAVFVLASPALSRGSRHVLQAPPIPTFTANPIPGNPAPITPTPTLAATTAATAAATTAATVTPIVPTITVPATPLSPVTPVATPPPTPNPTLQPPSSGARFNSLAATGTPPPPPPKTGTSPPPPPTTGTKPPPPPSTRSPPPPAGNCGTKTYNFTFSDGFCPASSTGTCGKEGYSNSGGPSSTQIFTDTLGGKFSSLTATLTGQSYSNPSYPFRQDLRINGRSFGGFPALGLQNGVVDCNQQCYTKGLIRSSSQTGYAVGASNTFSLPLTNGLNYCYPEGSPNCQYIYQFSFSLLTITVTTTC